MAAAPDVEVVAFPLASPELALVDAHLAAELRQCLRPVEDSCLRPRQQSKEVPASEEAAPSEQVVDDLSVAEPREAGHHESAERSEVEDTPSEGREMSSWYPILPAPEPGVEPIDATDAALRRIRERLSGHDASSAEPHGLWAER